MYNKQNHHKYWYVAQRYCHYAEQIKDTRQSNEGSGTHIKSGTCLLLISEKLNFTLDFSNISDP